ncbi:N-acetylglucosamine-6-sulfatase [Cryobacterium mesophilum]|uniref:GDSL-type esterase/lipase family protein n=1 Tax=Terrimesophilobacter mesophilus TaxID=433647 RepID=UPI001425B1EE|nr:GDSL-type esterase/lipase family protein [Terrimesophilobacter mesophilus]MBB5634085.1 N-acetylglucosamine-6-sulfatase [Terrimesophilobacter mesophilus]
MASTSARTVVFLGDSITAAGRWSDWFPDSTAVNLGVSGNKTADILNRIDEVVAAAPDGISLLIGTNDLGAGYPVDRVVDGVGSVVDVLRREVPDARLLLQSIMPRGREFARRIRRVNRRLRRIAPTVHAEYLDLWPGMATWRGALRDELTIDGLHLSEAGYAAWLELLRPAVSRLPLSPPIGSGTER